MMISKITVKPIRCVHCREISGWGHYFECRVIQLYIHIWYGEPV